MARHRSKAASAGGGLGSGGAPANEHLPHRRCAIYTRKSTEEGLDQDFNSLDAQREACEAYVLSQKHEGWRVLRQTYDDGGYSGGSMARPGLQALMAEVDAGEIDVVVVYKVDRLTRSLADFAKIVERFDARGVSFVSVTQAFNTTSSMGRLTLNVLLSFAQFEREVGAERVRDKVAASRRKGMWMGGTVPLGYRAENRKLVIDQAEADKVRTIFRRYLELGSTRAVLAELRERGITTAIRNSSTGRSVGGIPFGPGPLDYLLHNRIYIGDVEHRGEVYRGEHEAILDRATFEAVREMLAVNANIKRLKAQSQAILTGRIFDSRGNRMSPTHANKRGVRYHYYVSRAIAEGRPREAGEVRRLAAPEVERIVVDAVRSRLAEMPCAIDDAVGSAGSDDRYDTDADPTQALALVERHLRRVEVYRDHLLLSIAVSPTGTNSPAASEGGAILADPGDRGDGADITITLPWSPPATRPRCSMIADAGPADPEPSPMQRQLVQQIATARRWLDELTSGAIAGIEAIAAREAKHPRSIRAALSFALLAPDIVERIVAAEALPEHLTLTAIGRSLPMLWSEQRRMFGMAARR